MSTAPVMAALLAFEESQALQVTVHDVGGRLAGFVPAERFRHRDPRCQLVKYRGDKSACVRSDGPALYPRLLASGDVVLHRCHAGLLECVGPLIVDGMLDAVLYAGVLDPTGSVVDAVLRVPDLPPVPILADTPRAASQRLLAAETPPPAMDARRLALVAECMRQLLARLSLWLQQHVSLPPCELASDDWTQRRTRIERFVLYRHTAPVRLADLADTLGVSTSRAGHAVRQACDCSWSDLLTAARLATAEVLLVDTDLPVSEVAQRSGFTHATHFHRMFRKHRAISPGAYRRLARASGA